MKKYIANSKLMYFLAILLIAVFMLNTNPFKGETVAPMDLLLQYPGWQNVDIKYSPIHPERSDIVDVKLPQWIVAKEQIRNVEFPFWNMNASGGYPEAHNFTRSIITPAFFVFAIIKNNATAFYFSNLTNVLIGMMGMFLFLSLFFNRSIGLFGAVVFMFSGFNAAWFFWPHIDTSIWIPWMLYFASMYLFEHKIKWIVSFILSAVLLNLGGFPIVAVMGYMALGIMILSYLIYNKYNLVKFIKEILSFAFFLIIAFLITMPFIYPLIELFDFIGGIGYRGGGTIYKLSDFKLFVNPFLYGEPRVEKTLYVGLLPLLLTFIGFYLLIKKKEFINIFAFILLLISLSIAFALINPDILRMMPILDHNPWNRFSLLVDFSLAIIASYALHTITHKVTNRLFYSLFFGLILIVQIMDQKILFNSFNNSISDKAFYPKTPTIEFVQKNIKPLQYAIADNGYIVSGTLGAYGISEWYAHAFKSHDEKKILNKLVKNPFRTATAAVIKCGNINYNSKYMDLLNIKYILCSSNLVKNIALWDNKGEQRAAPPLPQNSLSQKFVVSKTKKVDGVKLLVATYNNNNFKSNVKLSLFEQKTLVAETTVKKEKIKDNQWVTFVFKSPITLEKNEKYHIKVALVNPTKHDKLTIWSNVVNANANHKLFINGKPQNLTFKMEFIRNPNLSSKFKQYTVEPNITLIENKDVVGSAYFIKSLKGKSKSMRYSNIDVKILSNHRFKVKYNGTEDGYVILPMRYYNGWKAINVKTNKTMIVKKFIGMLPAIKVTSGDSFIFEYTPTNFTKTLYFSLIGWIFIFGLIIVNFRKKQGKNNETNNTNTML